MSRTDKDKPLWVRQQEANAPEFHSWNYYSYFPTKYHESTVGLDSRGVKQLKRLRSKKNRRRETPHLAMRGYGWGDENIRVGYQD